jgi:hypothetical protein
VKDGEILKKSCDHGEPLWLNGKVVENEKINEIERTRVRSPPRAKKVVTNIFRGDKRLSKMAIFQQKCLPSNVFL